MREWVAFWNTTNSIYVSERHRDRHYGRIADDIRSHIPSPQAVVLDYGCGEALHADRVAAAAGRLVLTDAAPTVREHLSQRFARDAKIEVQTPEAVEAMGDGTFDLIVLNSVAQYLSADEINGLLAMFRRLLRADGKLVVGDVVPPAVSPVTDAMALLRFAAAEGFFVAAVFGLARTVFSDYRKLRARLGLTFYDEAAMLALLKAAGFSAQRAPANIGHNQSRMTFVASRAG